jgi:hypothetical protein
VADSVTALSKLPTAAVVIVDSTLPPGGSTTTAGEAEIVKYGVVTRSIIFTVCVTPPPVPITVKGYDPRAVPAGTVTVITEVPVPGAGMGLLEKLAVTPLGSPETLSVTLELNPFSAVVLMADAPLSPGPIMMVVGEAFMLKVTDDTASS